MIINYDRKNKNSIKTLYKFYKKHTDTDKVKVCNVTFYILSNLVRSRILYVFFCMSCDLTLEQFKPTNVGKRR